MKAFHNDEKLKEKLVKDMNEIREVVIVVSRENAGRYARIDHYRWEAKTLLKLLSECQDKEVVNEIN